MPRLRPLAWSGVRRGAQDGMSDVRCGAQDRTSDVRCGAQVQLPAQVQLQLPAQLSNSTAQPSLGDPVRTAGCSLSVYNPCHLSGPIVIESMSLFGTNANKGACSTIRAKSARGFSC